MVTEQRGRDVYPDVCAASDCHGAQGSDGAHAVPEASEVLPKRVAPACSFNSGPQGGNPKVGLPQVKQVT